MCDAKLLSKHMEQSRNLWSSAIPEHAKMSANDLLCLMLLLQSHACDLHPQALTPVIQNWLADLAQALTTCIKGSIL